MKTVFLRPTSRPMRFRHLSLLLILAPASPAAAEPARACLHHGPGFVEVPGTATCIRVGGRVTAGYSAVGRRRARDDRAGFGSAARLSADVRTDTAYGPLRAFVRVRAGHGVASP